MPLGCPEEFQGNKQPSFFGPQKVVENHWANPPGCLGHCLVQRAPPAAVADFVAGAALAGARRARPRSKL